MWGPGRAMCVWTLYWSMLGPSWGRVGPCGSCVGAIWGQRWAKLEFSETMLHNCVTAQEKNICCATICCIDYSGVGMEKKTLTIENWVKLEVSEDNDKNRVGIKRWYSCLWWFCITLSVEAVCFTHCALRISGCKDWHVLNQNVLFIAFQWVSEASWAWCFG